MATERLTAERVRELRAEFTTPGATFDHVDLAKKHGLVPRYVGSALIGESFGNLPGAVTREYLQERQAKRGLDETSVAWVRRRCLDPNDNFGVVATARFFDTTKERARRILIGEIFPEAGFIVPVEHLACPLSDEEVIAMRLRFREANGAITVEQMAKEIGRKVEHTRQLLNGTRRKHLPHAITIPHRGRKPLGLPDEVVLFIRILYASGKVSRNKLEKAYGIDADRLTGVIDGTDYPHVPLIENSFRETYSTQRVNRKLTDQQVAHFRTMYTRGLRTLTSIARQTGMSLGPIRSMLYGKTYKDLPGACAEGFQPKRTVRRMKIRSVWTNEWRSQLIPVRECRDEKLWREHRPWSPSRRAAQPLTRRAA
jgi:hypothetical protein